MTKTLYRRASKRNSDTVSVVVTNKNTEIQVSASAVTNLTYLGTIASVKAASQIASAYASVYKYYRITKMSVRAVGVGGVDLQMNTATAQPQVEARGMYATRVQLEDELDPPDNVQECFNSSYARLHKEGTGFYRSWVPRAVVYANSNSGQPKATMIAKPFSWFQTQAADGDQPGFYGLQVVMDQSSFRWVYEVWTTVTIQFKTRINH